MRNKALRSVIIGAVSCFVLFSLGCSAVNMPSSGGVVPGMLVNNSTVPAALTANDVYTANPDSFVVTGMVEGVSNSGNILGLFSFGDSGYRKAIDNAKTKANADGLINCVCDIKTSSFLGIYASSKTVVRGLAIKRKH